MDNVPGTSDNAKFFFNKDKSAFRAGYVSNDNWNINSLGLYSFAAGSDTTASGKSSTAMGAFTIAQSYSEVVLGVYNDTATSVNSSYFDLSDRLFTIGNGLNLSNRRNALVVYKNGNMEIAGEINNPKTGNANLIPVDYGVVSTTGIIQTAKSTNNFTITKTSIGIYQMTVNLNDLATSIANVNINDTPPGFISYQSSGSSIRVYTFSSSGAAQDRNFSFTIYNK